MTTDDAIAIINQKNQIHWNFQNKKLTFPLQVLSHCMLHKNIAVRLSGADSESVTDTTIKIISYFQTSGCESSSVYRTLREDDAFKDLVLFAPRLSHERDLL